MSGQPTRAGLSPDTDFQATKSWVPAEWRRFAAFLRHPVLPDRAQLSLGASVRALVPLFVLDLLLMALVLGGIQLATKLGMHMPRHMLENLELGPVLIGFMVIGAPLGEEIIFRGWLSGRPGHIAAVLALLIGFAAFALVPGEAVKLAAAIAAVVIAIIALVAFRKRDALRVFQRHFGWFYAASVLLFAGIHLTNFAGAGFSPTLLPLVLPQFLLALILGYLRINRGLLTGAALHMLHNTLFVGLMLAGMK
jgi:membrane protease YdiL (CAAX protease family)